MNSKLNDLLFLLIAIPKLIGYFIIIFILVVLWKLSEIYMVMKLMFNYFWKGETGEENEIW